MSSSNNTLKRNVLASNEDGIQLQGACSYNTVLENNFTQTTHGVLVSNNVMNNTFYQNNFNNNTQQASGVYSSEAMNTWDNGYQGNYWSNYNGTDENHDGIGDTPFGVFKRQIINNNDPNSTQYVNIEQDNYPLMTPFSLP
ncbi:MAG: hypothetical protein NWF05_02875 [Candidatus Bathyarchaeota archaeon]|nr:hypothetical protein [Candidatus Bathyarchaeota archaeon]